MNLVASNTNEPNCKPLSIKTGPNSDIDPPSLSIVKEEISAEDYSSIPVFCKKVRQAQQAKGLWSGPISNSYPTIINQQSVITSNYSNCSNITASGIRDSPLNIETAKVTSLNSQQIRAKKIPYVHERDQLQFNDTNSTEKDGTLPENLGIPRERVISICNMDKKELDDYLNVAEESEDQDPELLQYFQAGENDIKAINIGHISTNTNTLQDANKINTNSYKFETKPSGTSEQINQLRSYLHQNLGEKNLVFHQNLNKGYSLELNSGLH